MTEPISIIQTTWNRIGLLKKSLNSFFERTKTPYRFIIIDNNSTDGTIDYLKKLKKDGKIDIMISDGINRTIAGAFSKGFEYVKSEYFITTNDDIRPPDIKPDWLQRLLTLIKKYPDHGGIDCRVQHIPFVKWDNDHPDLSYPRKSLGGYLRIQKKSDVEKMGGFGDRTWDDIEFFKRMTGINKKCAYAKNVWADHMGYMLPNKGYGDFKDYPLYKKYWSEERYKQKPYFKIDLKTNKPV